MKQIAILLCALALPPLTSCTTGRTDKPWIRNTISYSGGVGGLMTEGHRSVNGRLLFQPPTEGGYIQARIVTSWGKQIEARWPDRARPDSLIDPRQVYRIELLTRTYAGRDYVFNDVLRVWKTGHVLIDASICQVHQLPMQRQAEDGKSAEAYPNSFFPLRKKGFPNDGNTYLACGSGISHPTWRCAECSRQYHIWTKRHGVDESW